MILYNLVCANGHEFESWFRDSKAYDLQAAKGHVICPMCASTKVEKAIMAPRLAKGKGSGPEDARPLPQPHTIGRDEVLARKIAELRAYVEKNYTYVGPRFAEEARRIHNGEADERNIWGEATPAEARELQEEGVPVAPLPIVPRRDS